MDGKTLKALKGSIAKWEAIVAGVGKDHGEENCPLCRRFIDQPKCGDCPVAKKANNYGCRNTPYAAAVAHEGSKDYPVYAQAELDFLKSLLPDAEPSSPTPTPGDRHVG